MRSIRLIAQLQLPQGFDIQIVSQRVPGSAQSYRSQQRYANAKLQMLMLSFYLILN